MKRTFILLLLTLPFAVTCQQQAPDQSSANAPQVGKPNTPQTIEQMLLPTWTQQLNTIGVAPDDVTFIDVTFSGPILQRTNNKRRAIIPRDIQEHHPHPHTAYLMASAYSVDVAAFERAFPNACHENGRLVSTCKAELNRVGLRISGAGPSLYGFDTSHVSFKKVQKITTYLPELTDDVQADDVPVNSPVRAYFELGGGGFTATGFGGCPVKFVGEPDTACREFARASILRLIFKGGVSLQVRTPTATNWTTHDIALDRSYVQLHIANESADSSVQHHDIFGGLAKGGFVDLPDVVRCGGCVEPLGEVPGCGNNQWP